jgi:hypothetical protein
MLKRAIATSLVCLTGSAAVADQTITNLQTTANAVMDQVRLSRTLATGASYYAAKGGIAPDGSVTRAQLSATMVSAYNTAISDVQSASYYSTADLLTDNAAVALDNLSVAVDSLVAATTTFAAVSAVADMAADADTISEQQELQATLNTSDMTITDADVAEYNTALADVETYAQEAAGFLSASQSVEITSGTDNWTNQNNFRMDQTATASYTAENDLLIMTFVTQNGDGYATASVGGYMTGNFKTVDDIYNAGIAYGG